MNDSMMDAIKGRKGQAITLEITITPKEGGEGVDASLAQPEEPAMMGDKPLEDKAPELDEAAALDDEMMADVSEFDKQRLETGKPKSLGERAKQDALARMKSRK